MPAKKRVPAKRAPYSARTDKRPIQIWLSDDERQKIESAAEQDMRPMTQVLLLGGLMLAERILEKSRKKIG